MAQDAASYQDMLDRLEKLEAVAAVQTGLQDMEGGKVRPPRKALKDLEKNLDSSVEITETALEDAENHLRFPQKDRPQPWAAERWRKGLLDAAPTLPARVLLSSGRPHCALQLLSLEATFPVACAISCTSPSPPKSEHLFPKEKAGRHLAIQLPLQVAVTQAFVQHLHR